MLLIMSGDYVHQELGAEFGKVPPSFLPLANKRLFQHQVELVKNGEPVYLVLPECYEVNLSDLAWLEVHHVDLIKIDSKLSLGQAIVTALNLIDQKQLDSLRILFGDTLFKTLPIGYDLVSISRTNHYYRWAHFNHTGLANQSSLRNDDIVCGYFTFSNANRFIKELVLNRFDFIVSLDKYRQNNCLAAVPVDDWLDFGHINTYYKSKVQFTTERSFNELSITFESVEKSSLKNNKIQAESEWFANIPAPLKLYTPQLLKEYSDSSKSYKLEYLYNTALNELFVFSSLPKHKLLHILDSCLSFVDICKHYTTDISATGLTSQLFSGKTDVRLKQFSQAMNFSLEEQWHFNNELSVSIQKLLDDIDGYLPTDMPVKSVMHGDLCFSNVIYDFRTDRVKVIDPRGITPSGELTIYGDYRYDIAKLAHSVLGFYDWIIAGYFNLNFNLDSKVMEFCIDVSSEHLELQELFIKMVSERYGIHKLSLYAMQIHLFLSMLPLHNDNHVRQQALFANAFRLYKIIKDVEL